MAFAVVFDANVLYPISLTDFFLTLAGYGLYRPHWSTEILREVERNLLEKNPRVTTQDLGYRFREMNRAYEGALVDPPKELVDAMTNDPKDRHVLACAVAAQASVIVTFNFGDFPVAACDPYEIEVQHPDVFAEHIVSLGPKLRETPSMRCLNEPLARIALPKTSSSVWQRTYRKRSDVSNWHVLGG